MDVVEKISYIMCAFGGLWILLLQYGILVRKKDEPNRALRWIGYGLLVSGIVLLAQACL